MRPFGHEAYRGDAVTKRRFLAPLSVIGSVGIALTPALAQASTPSHAPATQRSQSGHPLILPQTGTRAAGSLTYTSPATRTVRHSTRTGASAPNPDMSVSLEASTSQALGISVVVKVAGLESGIAKVTVDWGDLSGATTVTFSSSNPVGTLNHEFGTPGVYPITVTVNDGRGDVVSNSLPGVATAGSGFYSYGPVRILDTRSGLGAPAGPVAAGGTLKLQVTGAGMSDARIPEGITAVVLNVTVADPTADGVLTAYGDDDRAGVKTPVPGTSSLNFRAHETVPNLVVAPVGPSGIVDLYNNSKGTTQIVADVEGYFSPTAIGEYHPIAPVRILDTRNGTGIGKAAQIPANGTLKFHVSGLTKDGNPVAVTAVALNLTAVDATRSGVLTADPANLHGLVTTTSNVNFAPGQTTSNMAVVTLGDTLSTTASAVGDIEIHNSSSAPVDVVADAFGYFTGSADPEPAGGSVYVPFPAPVRVLDTRADGGPVQSGKPYLLPFQTDSAVTAAVFNATIADPTRNGSLSVYPYDPSDPGAVPTISNVDYAAGQTIPNLVIATPGNVATKYDLFEMGAYLGGSGTAQLILDESGFFENQ
jgi:hypothetical protein